MSIVIPVKNHVIPDDFVFVSEAGETKLIRDPVLFLLQQKTKLGPGSIFFRLRRRENFPV
jgi:hypothetical protein